MNSNQNFDNKLKATQQAVASTITPTKGFDERVCNTLAECRPNMKKTVAVIFGGCSTEYSVSLQSAHAVISHMDRTKYTPVMVGISPKGEWFLFRGNTEKIATDTWCNSSDCTRVLVSPERMEHCLLALVQTGIEKIHIDMAFPVLHGKNGEDGTIQGLFELADIPVVGCGVLSSALCMDKHRAHTIVHAAGIAVPISFIIEKDMDVEIALAQAEQLGYPLFVKPVRSGSSYGISKVSDSVDLPTAIQLAFEHDDKVIVEECISGFEVGCAVIGKENLIIGEVDEIELAQGFFDFNEKYTLKTSTNHVPARVSHSTAEELKEVAKAIYKTLDCHGFARVDMFLSEAGEILFNEVNTIPGFTAHSRFPNMMKAKGLSFVEIISQVIELAVKK